MSDLGIYGHEPHACPACGAGNDLALATPENSDGAPEPGDISICGSCGWVSIYAEGGVMRDPSAKELLAMMDNEQLRRALLAWAEVNAHE